MITCMKILIIQIDARVHKYRAANACLVQRRMIGKALKLFTRIIVGLILFNNLCNWRLITSVAADSDGLSGTSINSDKECPTNNNSVCVKGYLHLVECFKNISQNQENFSFAFFPNNKAFSLYVTVTYTLNYSQDDSDNANNNVSSSYYIEEWVWSHTVVYIMYHPTIFKYLSIGYGMIDERINSVELTIPRLCHNNTNNHKLIERLTQKVCSLL